MPVFLLSSRTMASEVPADILDKVNDFIWILEDTADFITGRILAATKRYREFILPPMFKALAQFAAVHEYSWHTPGHTGGTAFLKSPVGRAFFNFFGEEVFRPTFPFRWANLVRCWTIRDPDRGKRKIYCAGFRSRPQLYGYQRFFDFQQGDFDGQRNPQSGCLVRPQLS